MPALANITVKKFDGTTDITYTALSPAAGDRNPARWRVETAGSVPANRPVLEIQSKPTLDKMARIVEGKLLYPETFTDSTTGLVSIRLKDQFAFTAIVRQDALDITTNEIAAQAANLIKSPLVQSVITSGYAPT